MVKKQELKEGIVRLINESQGSLPQVQGSMDYTHAPVFIILFGDTRTKSALPKAARSDPQICQSIFTSSLASAFLYMHLAVTTLGLASQWVTAVQVPAVNSGLRDLLGIPLALEVYDMMAVGYPAARSRPKFMRAKENVLHYDYCGNEEFRTQEQVNDFIKRIRTWVIATSRREADQQTSLDTKG